MRGDRLKAAARNEEQDEMVGTIPMKIFDHRAKRIPSPLWRECIRKVLEVDPLICPHCAADMRIISFINAPQVIRRILDHLGVSDEMADRKCAPPAQNADVRKSDTALEAVDDGWLGYVEPANDVQG